MFARYKRQSSLVCTSMLRMPYCLLFIAITQVSSDFLTHKRVFAREYTYYRICPICPICTYVHNILICTFLYTYKVINSFNITSVIRSRHSYPQLCATYPQDYAHLGVCTGIYTCRILRARFQVIII